MPNLHTDTARLVLNTPGRACMLSQLPLSVDEILKIHEHPFRLCPDCGGTGIGGLAIIMGEELGAMMPVACPQCEGRGLSQYASNS